MRLTEPMMQGANSGLCMCLAHRYTRSNLAYHFADKHIHVYFHIESSDVSHILEENNAFTKYVSICRTRWPIRHGRS